MNEITIEMSALVKRYGPVQVLKGVSSRVESGEIVGLVGRNGAGKSTLLDCLAGLKPVDEGQCRILGVPSGELTDAERANLGVVFQQDELFEGYTVRKHLELVGAHYPSWDSAYADDLRQRWSLPSEQRVEKLSGGQRQLLAVILAIAHRPRLLLMDEPASALDPLARRRFLTELVSLACDAQTTMVLSSHQLADIERLASRIWLLRDGRLALDESLDTLKDSVVGVEACSTITGPTKEPSWPDGAIPIAQTGASDQPRWLVKLSPDMGRQTFEEQLAQATGARWQVKRLDLESLSLEVLE